MTQSNQPDCRRQTKGQRDLFTRVAQLEYRLNRIEHNQEQLENTMTPGGYITEAFERVHEEIDQFRSDVNNKLDAQNQKLDEQNRKIDTILRQVMILFL